MMRKILLMLLGLIMRICSRLRDQMLREFKNLKHLTEIFQTKPLLLISRTVGQKAQRLEYHLERRRKACRKGTLILKT